MGTRRKSKENMRRVAHKKKKYTTNDLTQ